MSIGNRPHEAGRYDGNKRQFPLVYQGMLEQLARAGGEATMGLNGEITAQFSTHVGVQRLPGSHQDWLRCVAWGMVEGVDGTKLRLTALGRTQTTKSGTPDF